VSVDAGGAVTLKETIARDESKALFGAVSLRDMTK
jgi:hypothetical protein